MLGVAGASAYVWSWKIGVAVAIVMLTVVASYRQTVHAYPSGGGDYEVATVNLGRNAGVTVASALLVDYVLTVAVSISSASQYAAGAIPAFIGREPHVATVLVLLLMAMNLRGVRESGAFFAVPTYLFMAAILGMCAVGFLQLLAGTLPDAESAAPPDRAGARVGGAPHHGGAGLPAGACLLVRVCGAHRRGGDLERRAGVPEAQEPQRRDHAAAPRPDRGLDDAQRHRARQPDEHQVRRPARARPPAQLDRGRPARGLRAAPGDLPDRPRRVRRLQPRLLLRGRGHRRDPGPRGQHRLQRVPGARLHPRQGRAGAPCPRLARGPARLQQRHRVPGDHVDHPHPGVPGRDHEADPALHRGGLRVVQPQPAGDDPPLDAPPEDGDRHHACGCRCSGRGRSTRSDWA